MQLPPTPALSEQLKEIIVALLILFEVESVENDTEI